ncbi:MAG: hypothetical protein JNK67_28005 [Alphaproteobacteria bacterium]|nr:hypothetical protein [Alphaproteobacteria bacterium]
MPWYVTAYVLVLIALAGMSWQVGARIGLPAFLRNGDVLSTLASIVLTIAYWHERWRLAVGMLAVPLFVGVVAWLVYAVKPMMRLGLELAAATAGHGGDSNRSGAILSCVIGVLISAPALFWGFRVARAALGL